jgi:murein DD-endopeptidase MepM/ murein hydrolase activator NlpD
MQRLLTLSLIVLLLALSLTPTAQAAGPCGDRYTVQRGDTLSRIARRCGTTVAALTQANHIRNANRIYAGQVLVIPGGGPTPPPQSAARVVSFRVSPTTFKPGEVLRLQWQAVGNLAVICPVKGWRPIENRCVQVSPDSGVLTLNTDEAAVEYTGFQLRVEAGPAVDSATVAVSVNCQGYRDWFFTNAPTRCPQSSAVATRAASQRFERGRMIWLENTDWYYVFLYGDPATKQPLRIVVGPLGFKPGASPDNRIGLTPPPGLVEPVSGFGLLWRGEVYGAEGLREQLGWAVENEFGFETRTQCEAGVATGWSCYLQTPEGTIFNAEYNVFGSLMWSQR